MQPTHQSTPTLALALTEAAHTSFLATTKPFTPSMCFYSLLLEKDANFGSLELLELSPSSKIVGSREGECYVSVPFGDTELQQFVFSLEGDPQERLGEMKVPRGTIAMCLSYTVVMSPRIINPDGSLGSAFEFSRFSMIRATTALTADGTHWTAMSPGQEENFEATQELWNELPLLMGEVFRRSFN